ncbi:NAD(P)/FAD-dependent oxidoreductase [Candidatus Woesearchaeota archaeon]|nr:NAD(P)/FAD-dependent oxidoreductase [Candidatus Woesearchaeota archaeon]
MKIAIIGAGPAGGFSAYLLAKAGMDVSIYEEHATIGEPVACTGVITGDVMARQLQLPKELILNKISKARIIAPNKEFIEVRLKNDIIIDRAGLDRHIAAMAEENGAKIFTNHRFENLEYCNSGKNERERIIVAAKNKTNNEMKKVETDFLIGADGPVSSVAKASGLFGNRKFYSGIQVTIPVKNDNAIDFYPSENGIAWVVPENEGVARVGIAANKEANAHFRRFLTAVAGSDYEKKIIGWQAGPIPIYDPRLKSATKDGKILLVGDAATMVKAPTLGGINQSLIGAQCAADSLINGSNYEKLWKKKMGMDLYISLLMRKAMEKFSNTDYNSLVGTFRKEKNRKLLEKYDRDEPRKFALKLLLNEPGILLLAKKAWF